MDRCCFLEFVEPVIDKTISSFYFDFFTRNKRFKSKKCLLNFRVKSHKENEILQYKNITCLFGIDFSQY